MPQSSKKNRFHNLRNAEVVRGLVSNKWIQMVSPKLAINRFTQISNLNLSLSSATLTTWSIRMMTILWLNFANPKVYMQAIHLRLPVSGGCSSLFIMHTIEARREGGGCNLGSGSISRLLNSLMVASATVSSYSFFAGTSQDWSQVKLVYFSS